MHDAWAWLHLGNGLLSTYSEKKSILETSRLFDASLPFISVSSHAAALETRLKDRGLSKIAFWLIVPGYKTIARAVHFPGIKKRQLHRVLAWEWTEFFPLPRENFFYDVLAIAAQNNPGLEVWVVACLRKELHPWLKVCEEAGLVLAGADISSLCINSALQEDVVVIEAGAKESSVSGFADLRFFYHNTFPASVPHPRSSWENASLEQCGGILPLYYTDFSFGTLPPAVLEIGALALPDSLHRSGQRISACDYGFLSRRGLLKKSGRRYA